MLMPMVAPKPRYHDHRTTSSWAVVRSRIGAKCRSHIYSCYSMTRGFDKPHGPGHLCHTPTAVSVTCLVHTAYTASDYIIFLAARAVVTSSQGHASNG